jgi:uncharacterized protein
MEFKRIKKKLKSMPIQKRKELENQHRYYGTCIFYDLEKDQCGIHSARPDICRLFGHHQELVCFRKPELARNTTPIGPRKEMGVLSLDIKWEHFR